MSKKVDVKLCRIACVSVGIMAISTLYNIITANKSCNAVTKENKKSEYIKNQYMASRCCDEVLTFKKHNRFNDVNIKNYRQRHKSIFR